MWYTTKVGPDVKNEARKLAVHMSHPGPEYWNTLRHLIGYIKGKYTKCIIIRKHKVLKAVMFCDLNDATDKETGNSASSLVDTLGRKIIMCQSKTQRTVIIISTEE